MLPPIRAPDVTLKKIQSVLPFSNSVTGEQAGFVMIGVVRFGPVWTDPRHWH